MLKFGTIFSISTGIQFKSDGKVSKKERMDNCFSKNWVPEYEKDTFDETDCKLIGGTFDNSCKSKCKFTKEKKLSLIRNGFNPLQECQDIDESECNSKNGHWHHTKCGEKMCFLPSECTVMKNDTECEAINGKWNHANCTEKTGNCFVQFWFDCYHDLFKSGYNVNDDIQCQDNYTKQKDSKYQAGGDVVKVDITATCMKNNEYKKTIVNPEYQNWMGYHEKDYVDGHQICKPMTDKTVEELWQYPFRKTNDFCNLLHAKNKLKHMLQEFDETRLENLRLRDGESTPVKHLCKDGYSSLPKYHLLCKDDKFVIYNLDNANELVQKWESNTDGGKCTPIQELNKKEAAYMDNKPFDLNHEQVLQHTVELFQQIGTIRDDESLLKTIFRKMMPNHDVFENWVKTVIDECFLIDKKKLQIDSEDPICGSHKLSLPLSRHESKDAFKCEQKNEAECNDYKSTWNHQDCPEECKVLTLQSSFRQQQYQIHEQNKFKQFQAQHDSVKNQTWDQYKLSNVNPSFFESTFVCLGMNERKNLQISYHKENCYGINEFHGVPLFEIKRDNVINFMLSPNRRWMYDLNTPLQDYRSHVKNTKDMVAKYETITSTIPTDPDICTKQNGQYKDGQCELSAVRKGEWNYLSHLLNIPHKKRTIFREKLSFWQKWNFDFRYFDVEEQDWVVLFNIGHKLYGDSLRILSTTTKNGNDHDESKDFDKLQEKFCKKVKCIKFDGKDKDKKIEGNKAPKYETMEDSYALGQWMVFFDKSNAKREYELFYWYDDQLVHFGTMFLNNVNKDMGSIKLTPKSKILVSLMLEKFEIIKNRTEVIMQRIKFVVKLIQSIYTISFACVILAEDFGDETLWKFGEAYDNELKSQATELAKAANEDFDKLLEVEKTKLVAKFKPMAAPNLAANFKGWGWFRPVWDTYLIADATRVLFKETFNAEIWKTESNLKIQQ